ncbi:YifB family Mg chelatase-like AAA ATPase [Chryseolinea sp. T2]|uniref:YifB family Mg chelatase-like AAA ATPase n=1 Tax=Chryseolinea sp. T2 TaxID=3129255 RepID=UPI00307814DD
MVAKTFGGAVHGVDARTIMVEVNVGQGTKFFMSGLPDSAVKESQHRVESALKSCGYFMPRNKTVVNLAPADLRKEGAAYDLPIALCVLKASGQLSCDTIADFLIMGELTLDGTLRPIRGVLPIAIQASRQRVKALLLPADNAKEAGVVNDVNVIGLTNLRQAVEFLENKISIEPVITNVSETFKRHQNVYDSDFKDVQGQENIKRAMEIAAAGGHNLIMIGPPGAGKTMLARRLPTILPPLTLQEALETTKIHSVAGRLSSEATLLTARPFRAPHHTISDIALVGGGSHPQPGEISLANNGVLFLDELPEFRRSALEVMRQPMEERRVTLSRARNTIEYPANFMLVASMNPCPCGYFNHPDKECVCAPGMVQRYINRVSGPLLDRIDMHVEVVPVAFDELTASRIPETSDAIRGRVVIARALQTTRFVATGGIYCNAMMPSGMVKRICNIDDGSRRLLKNAIQRLGLSARAYDRILRVALTIADLEGKNAISSAHIAEAITYRSLDRSSWSAYRA